MDEALPFGTPAWWLTFVVFAAARSLDLVSTRVATPSLALEGNPIAKKLGWRGGILVNLLLSLGLAFYPFIAVTIATTSLLVAARNFHDAWIMRTMGEESYRFWYSQRYAEAGFRLYFSCLLGQSLPAAIIGAALLSYGQDNMVGAIGLGCIGYACALLLYSLLALRPRRS